MNKAIKLLILDVDGVMTDGKFFLTPDGDELKCFHAQDGLGIKRCQRAGMIVAIISGRSSQAVTRRAKELDIKYVHQGVADKRIVLQSLLKELELDAQEVACVGDDLADLAIMETIGLKIAVSNAVPEVLSAADWVSNKPGGSGAVREICDWLLSNQDA